MSKNLGSKGNLTGLTGQSIDSLSLLTDKSFTIYIYDGEIILIYIDPKKSKASAKSTLHGNQEGKKKKILIVYSLAILIQKLSATHASR